MRGGCGSEVVLETVNASRAFLTIDSGFPLADLEQALRTNRPFKLRLSSHQVPVLYRPRVLASAQGKSSRANSSIPSSAIRRCAGCTSAFEAGSRNRRGDRKTIPAQPIKVFAHVLDFFGGMFESATAKPWSRAAPASARPGPTWRASPGQGRGVLREADGKDDGWLASLLRCAGAHHGPVQDYLTDRCA